MGLMPDLPAWLLPLLIGVALGAALVLLALVVIALENRERF